jgi:hypothetical protein
MRFFLTSLFLILSISPAIAQSSYYQQQIDYKISVSLDPETARLAGAETINYHNNSPDTLAEIYFHLFYNAFKPDSYLDRYYQSQNEYYFSGISPKSFGYVDIDLIRMNGLEIKNYQIDNTILKVPLNQRLLPGDSTYIYLEFTSQIPEEGGRTARKGKHFDVGQWFPKPALYDKNGWHANQYLENSEFFSDFGNYDVEISLPSDFIVAHSGKLLNESEIFGGKMPVPDGDSIIVDALKYIVKDSIGTSRENLLTASPLAGDSINIQSLALNDTSVVKPGIRQDSLSQSIAKLRTWKIKADSIHDFAFCADPDFIVDICRYKDIIIKSYYAKSSKKDWQYNGADYSRKAIKYFSERFLSYPYEEFSTVRSLIYGAMEYPQLIMISDKYFADKHSRDSEATIAHEVAHNWFYGILAFDETEEAFLDEGLTSFATSSYLEHYYGRYANNLTFSRRWQKILIPNGNNRNSNQRDYLQKAISQTEDPMAISANLFKDSGRYSNASYDKASSVYFMLQYMLGDGGFERFLHILFERWAFKHPYLSDIENIAEEVYGGDLRYFFKQWFTTTWTLDYSIDSFKTKRISTAESIIFETNVRIRNLGRCISPLDLVCYHYDSSQDTILIPVSHWSDGQTYFDTTLSSISRPRRIALNPDLRLADINRLNNISGWLQLRWQYQIPEVVYPNRKTEHFVESYTIEHKPSFWYNLVDGFKVGYFFQGSYLETMKNINLQFDLGLKSKKTGYFVKFENRWLALKPQVRYFISSTELEGRGRQEFGLRYEPEDLDEPQMTQAKISLVRSYLFNRSYISGYPWSPGEVATLEMSFSQKMSQRFSVAILQGTLTSSIPGSDYKFSSVAGGLAVFMSGIGVGETRLTLRAGVSEGHVPYQRRYFLSSLSPYAAWDSPLYRSRGTLPEVWKRKGHLIEAGGAGLSGYWDRSLSGQEFAAGRVSNDLPRIKLPVNIPYIKHELEKIASEIYFASGYIWDDTGAHGFDNFLWEAGLAFNYRSPFINRLLDEAQISFYLPLWLSDPDPGDKRLKWRWIISINR